MTANAPRFAEFMPPAIRRLNARAPVDAAALDALDHALRRSHRVAARTD